MDPQTKEWQEDAKRLNRLARKAYALDTVVPVGATQPELDEDGGLAKEPKEGQRSDHLEG